MFKIKLKPKNAPPSSSSSSSTNKKPLPKIKLSLPQAKSTSLESASTTESPGTKPSTTIRKPIKLKLSKPGSKIKKENSGPVVKRAPRIRVKPTRIPGEGYDSEASDIEDDPLIEEAIVLRLLPDAELDSVRHFVETGDFGKFFIKWKDRQRAIIYINNSIYGAKLINLPNIIEAQKTVDKKNIFKTVDVTQILLVVKKLDNESQISEIDVKEDEVYDSGITPPLHEITKSNARVQLSNPYIAKIESKVEELLRLDEEAEDSQFEMIDPDSLRTDYPTEYPIDTNGRDTVISSSNDIVREEDIEMEDSEKRNDQVDDLELELEQVLGEDLIIEDDLDGLENAEGEVEIEEELEEEVEEEEEEEEEEEDDDDEDDDDDDDEVSDNERGVSRKIEVDEDEQHNALLRDEINELLSTIEQNRSRLEKTHNPLLRSRFIDSISKLEKELENKKRQLKSGEDKTNSKKESQLLAAKDAQDEEDEDEEDDDGDADEDENDKLEDRDEGDDDLEDLFG